MFIALIVVLIQITMRTLLVHREDCLTRLRRGSLLEA